MSQPHALLVDCVHCKVEGAVIEWVDPDDPLGAQGIATERRCRMCGMTERGTLLPRPHLEQTVAPTDLTQEGRARKALERWAQEEGEDDLDQFCQGGFGLETDRLVAALTAGRPVETTFDAIAFLFPSAGTGTVGRSVARTGVTLIPDSDLVEPHQRVTVVLPRTDFLPACPSPGAGTPAEGLALRYAARLLASVLVAGGQIGAKERAFVDRTLASVGRAPLVPDDLRVWLPLDLGSPPSDPALRAKLMESAVQLMHLDGIPDAVEWRVVRTFAEALGIHAAVLEGWRARYDRRYSGWRVRFGRLVQGIIGVS